MTFNSEAAVEPDALEIDFEMAIEELTVNVLFGAEARPVDSMIPDEHRAGTILIGGNTAFAENISRVVVADSGDRGGSRPAIFEIVDGEGKEPSIEFESQVVMEVGGVMEIHNEPKRACVFRPEAGLTDWFKVSF